MDTTFENKKTHHGYSVKRLRDILGVKQEDLADRLQLSQQTMSKIEQKETIDEETLIKIAKALNIPVDAIKNFTEEATFNIVANTFDNYSSAVNYYPTFNPVDKVVELFERLLKAEQEKIALLQEVLKEKK